MYDTVVQMAEDAVGPQAADMESFAYRLVKPNVGVEYQFFFIEERERKNSNKKKGADDKVHQVTILQPYDELEIIAKEIHLYTTIHIMVIVQSGLDITNFVNTVHNICSNQQTVHFKCSLLMIFQNDNDRLLVQEKLTELNIDDSSVEISVV